MCKTENFSHDYKRGCYSRAVVLLKRSHLIGRFVRLSLCSGCLAQRKAAALVLKIWSAAVLFAKLCVENIKLLLGHRRQSVESAKEREFRCHVFQRC